MTPSRMAALIPGSFGADSMVLFAITYLHKHEMSASILGPRRHEAT